MVPTVCDVLTVGNIVTIVVHFTIEDQVYHDWKFKEQHAKIWENIVGRKDTLAPVVSTSRGRAPPSLPSFRRLWGGSARTKQCSEPLTIQPLHR